MATKTVAGFTIPVPEARTAFSELLPYERVFNKSLITGLAESQINPEINRLKYEAFQNLTGDLARSGAYRTGRGAQAQERLSNQIERQRKEQTQSFMDSIGGYTTDWYNRQQENYYKNPSAFVMPTLPSFDEFTKQNPTLMEAYNQQTNIPNTYNSPFSF